MSFPPTEHYDAKFNYPEHPNADKKTGTHLISEKPFSTIAGEFILKIGSKILTGN